MDTNDEVLVVTVGVFSGRPNPTFELVGPAARQWSELLASVVGVQAADPPPPTRLGEYYGFQVEPRADAIARQSTERLVRVFRGVVSVYEKRHAGHWRDTAELELFLAQRAVDAGHAELLRKVAAPFKLEPSRR